MDYDLKIIGQTFQLLAARAQKIDISGRGCILFANKVMYFFVCSKITGCVPLILR